METIQAISRGTVSELSFGSMHASAHLEEVEEVLAGDRSGRYGKEYTVEVPGDGPRTWSLEFKNTELFLRFARLSRHAKVDFVGGVMKVVTQNRALELEINWTPYKKRTIRLALRGAALVVDLL